MTKIIPQKNEKHLFNIHKVVVSQIRRIGLLIAIILPAIVANIFFQNNYVYIGTLVLLFAALIYGLYIFWIWYQNVVIVTNQRIIVVVRKTFFQLAYDEIDAADIENITYEIKGFLPTIFRYGTILIQMKNGEQKALESIHGLEVVHTSLMALVRAISHKHSG